jgi:hypothetical protein
MKTLLITDRDIGTTWLETDEGFATLYAHEPAAVAEMRALQPGRLLFFSTPWERETSPRRSFQVRRLGVSSMKIQRPGLPGGPCTPGNDGDACAHPECMSSRIDAWQRCQRCFEPIGYDKEFFQWTGAQFVHKSCMGEWHSTKCPCGCGLNV